MSTIWWIRRDLRLDDNRTLARALEKPPITPLYILDPRLLSAAPDRRQKFLFQNLRILKENLEARGSTLIVRTAKPVEVLERLVTETGADRILAEEDYTPYARVRSVLVGGCLPLKLIQGQLVVHPLGGMKSDGSPYTVFTPFKRNWLAVKPEIPGIPAPEQIPSLTGLESDPIPDGQEEERFPAGETEALSRLNKFLAEGVSGYHLNRDRMDLKGTSRLSPYLHFGVLGLRTAIRAAMRTLTELKGSAGEQGADTWLSELIWREFYIHILFHFPEVRTRNFRSQYDALQWRNDEADFAAWQEGQTGYPIVDAGMRQLLNTGWMHNRARMITASFLVKHLLIDWRWGESWFMEKLLDADLAANNGGWQWVAGTGTDAAPYFRIFNPILQSKKHDPEGRYIRRWVPELAGLDSREIHAPWENNARPSNYPAPIVDHKQARERTLLAYQSARER
jgi:deoxyribodipyrimidine photo-lyase